MKTIYIKTNKYNQIISSSYSKIKNYVEIKTNLEMTMLHNYGFVNEKLIYRKLTQQPMNHGIYEFDGEKWIKQ